MKTIASSLFISLLDMLTIQEHDYLQTVKFNASLSKDTQWRQLTFPNLHVKAYIYRKTLELEFYSSSDNVTVIISNQLKQTLYKRVINTVETMHLIIKTSNWGRGDYTILIKNMNGYSVEGQFFLD